MSDESLDNIFKKGLSGREVNFNMASWRNMEQMLPPEPKAAAFEFGAVASIIGVFFVLSASIFVWNITDDSDFSEYSNESKESSLGISTEKEPATKDQEVLVDANQNVNSSPVNVLGAKDSNAETTNQLEINNRVNPNSNGSSATVTNSQKVAFTSNTANSSGTPSPELNSSTSNKSIKSQSAFFQGSNSLISSIGNNENFKEEEISLRSNAFTEIAGLSELNSMTLLDEEDDNTLFAIVNESKLPSADKNTLGVIGGLNLNKSLTENPSGGIAGCEFFGITYQRYLNGGLSIKSNLLYSARNEVNAIKLYDKKVYGFGSKTQQTKVEAQRLAYLELPVMINYSMGNHNFMTGASVSYLLSSLHEVSTEYTSPTETTYENDMQWGYTNGFKSYDVALVAGYEYNVNPKLNLGLRLNYGLLDVTDNTYFGVDSFDNNVQFRVYLTYSPFQF